MYKSRMATSTRNDRLTKSVFQQINNAARTLLPAVRQHRRRRRPASWDLFCSGVRTATERLLRSCSLHAWGAENQHIILTGCKWGGGRFYRKLDKNSPRHSSTSHVALARHGAVTTWKRRKVGAQTCCLKELRQLKHERVLLGSANLAKAGLHPSSDQNPSHGRPPFKTRQSFLDVPASERGFIQAPPAGGAGHSPGVHALVIAPTPRLPAVSVWKVLKAESSSRDFHTQTARRRRWVQKIRFLTCPSLSGPIPRGLSANRPRSLWSKSW